MGEIQPGDWVTISGCGPYKVNDGSEHAEYLWINNYGPQHYVRREWCVKVPPPWKPEPQTYWLDTGYRTLWVVLPDGTVRQQGNIPGRAPVSPATIAASQYGPMVQLVPKEQADE